MAAPYDSGRGRLPADCQGHVNFLEWLSHSRQRDVNFKLQDPTSFRIKSKIADFPVQPGQVKRAVHRFESVQIHPPVAYIMPAKSTICIYPNVQDFTLTLYDIQDAVYGYATNL